MDGTSEGEQKMKQGGPHKKTNTSGTIFIKAPSLEVEERAEARAERRVKNDVKESLHSLPTMLQLSQ